LGGLEPPTSCSTDTARAPPELRNSRLSYEKASIFNEYARRLPPYLRCNWRYGGSYVVATEVIDGCLKYNDPCSASTEAG
jgi:hypothetical protein